MVPCAACIHLVLAAALIGFDAKALLASLQHSVEWWERNATENHRQRYLKRGQQLLRPRSLTGDVPQLSGLVLKPLMEENAPLPPMFLPHLTSVRKSSLCGIADGFVKRKQLHATKPPASDATQAVADDEVRTVNPLVALQSSPGGGKSTVLDCAAIASLHGLWHAFCDDPAMRSVLDESVAITVTYNSGSDPHDGDADADIGTGLSLRILRSFFAPRVKFATFASWLPSGARIKPVLAVQCCLDALRVAGHNHRGVLLLVDEVIALGSRASLLLSQVGRLLDAFPSEQFNAVCTTLNALPFLELASQSGRKLLWAPLPALPQDAVEAMIRDGLDEQALPLAVRIAVSDCAGHPRTQEYVLTTAGALKEADPDAWNTTANQPRLLQAIRTGVTAALTRDVATWAVRAALQGVPIGLEAVVPGSNPQTTLRQLIAAGTFLNTNIDTALRLSRNCPSCI